MARVNSLVALLEEAYRFQVLAPAVAVGNPLALFTGVVEIEHGGDGVNTEAVNVVGVQPEECVASQEVADLVAPEVEDESAPVGVLTQAWVFVLVEVGAVKVVEAVLVFGEVGGNPVEQDTDTVLVA